MFRFISLIAVAIGLLAAATANNLLAAEPPAALDIRAGNGDVLIEAGQIQSYDWASHTLKLAPGARGKLQAKYYGDLKLKKEPSLVSGIPFSVCVGGKPIYDGKFTTSVSSFSFDSPVIVLDFVIRELMAGENELRIQLGYPTEKFFKGDDPRSDPRIDQALRAANKFASARDDRIQWVAACLQEMQSIKQGSTREELLKVFVEEGGLSGRFQRRYAYRDCPYFKVDVKFNAADNPDEKIKEDPQDKVSQISTPFLEWPIAD